MTKIKMCGLTRPSDIVAANMLKPDYIGFVFAPQSKRYLTPEKANELKALLVPGIRAVGVFVNEEPETVAGLLEQGIIDMVQLHGDEDETYIARLRQLTSLPIIQAFQVRTSEDVIKAEASSADEILLDSGAGTGTVLNRELIRPVMRPYFLAGGLTSDNVGEAVRQLHPYAVDVSSGIERDGYKDQGLMAAFIAAVRKEDEV